MIPSMITSILAYVSTNIDDIFVIMILLAQVNSREKHSLIAGHFLGVGLVTILSMISALGLQNLPLKYTGFLGLVPIALGIRAWINRDDEDTDTKAAGLLSMAMITIGNSADNIGVYIPLFTGYSPREQLGTAIVFIIMTAVWVYLANSLAKSPWIKAVAEKFKAIAIPVVFIALGVFIILDSGLLR